MWARLSGQEVLPAVDIPCFVGNLHIPSTVGKGPWAHLPCRGARGTPCLRGSKGRNKKVASPLLVSPGLCACLTQNLHTALSFPGLCLWNSQRAHH